MILGSIIIGEGLQNGGRAGVRAPSAPVGWPAGPRHAK